MIIRYITFGFITFICINLPKFVSILHSIHHQPKFCCNQMDGCYFLTEGYDINDELCAEGRDRSSPLCGSCQKNKYELIGTTACGDCQTMSFYWLFLPFIFSAFITLYFVYFESTETELPQSIKEVGWHKLLIYDEIRALRMMIFKIMTYYYQALSQILSSKAVNHFANPILAIFDLSMEAVSNSSDHGICVIPYLNGLQEILLAAITIYFIIFHFLWISVVAKFNLRLSQILCCCCCKLTSIDQQHNTQNTHNSALSLTDNYQYDSASANEADQLLPNASAVQMHTRAHNSNMTDIIESPMDNMAPKRKKTCKDRLIKYLNQQPIINVAIIRLFLICSGSALKTSFKLLTCISLPNGETLHFYDTKYQCYDYYYFIALGIILLIIGIYIYLAMIIWRQEPLQRKDINNPYRKLLKSFKNDVFYWEFVLFSRRLFIAFFTSFELIFVNSVAFFFRMYIICLPVYDQIIFYIDFYLIKP